jgi:hypothetical protein
MMKEMPETFRTHLDKSLTVHLWFGLGFGPEVLAKSHVQIWTSKRLRKKHNIRERIGGTYLVTIAQVAIGEVKAHLQELAPLYFTALIPKPFLSCIAINTRADRYLCAIIRFVRLKTEGIENSNLANSSWGLGECKSSLLSSSTAVVD